MLIQVCLWKAGFEPGIYGAVSELTIWELIVIYVEGVTSALIWQGHLTSQNILYPIELEEFTFQMSQEQKLYDQQCGHSASG